MHGSADELAAVLGADHATREPLAAVHPLLAAWHERRADRPPSTPGATASTGPRCPPPRPPQRPAAAGWPSPRADPGPRPSSPRWPRAWTLTRIPAYDPDRVAELTAGAAGVIAVLRPGDPDPLPGLLALVQAHDRRRRRPAPCGA
ncbi:hypothetical protein LT493_00375 [Streptomyces tricolor]|nr:hypothetical protein [Streptomyces tricolor]